MNKTHAFIVSCFVLLMTAGCSKSFKYKYDDKPIEISCHGANTKLLNEALYSFFEDITMYYRTNSNDRSQRNMSAYDAYAIYAYKGALGEADYSGIVSEHTKKVMNELKKNTQLWDKKPAMSNLNYNSEFVNCLIENFTNEDMRISIQSLHTANSLTPRLLAERFRINIKNAFDDPNYAMYIALDTYYQYLYDLKL